jgi:hypothetical protein
MKGYFSEETLKQFAQLAGETFGTDFSEGDAYDFARCVRPDGTSYGTGGKCRKGTEQAKKEEAPKPKKAPKVIKEDPKGAYASLMKKQQELVQKGDIVGAMKLNDKIKAATQKIQSSPEQKDASAKLKEAAKEKVREAKNFEAAQKKRDEGQLAANLNAKDKKVITDYTKETMGQSPRSYDNMNACLRDPKKCPDEEVSKKFVKEFDSALSKLPKNEEGNPFYRGVTVYPGEDTEKLYERLEKAVPGTKLKDPGYGSYSAERRQAEHFMNRNRSNLVFVTRNKSMTPINMYSDKKEENEGILPRGTEQTIRSVRKEGNNLIIELD